MKKRCFSLLLTLVVLFPVTADEGMWMLPLLQQQRLSVMQEMGLQLDAADIYHPERSSVSDAVVQFGRGCTGEVISSEGLVLTNHHCGYGQLQQHSTLDHNYLEDGFWAMSKEEELPNPGLTVTFIEKIEDVTDRVRACMERDSAMAEGSLLYLSAGYLKGLAREIGGDQIGEGHAGVEVEIKPFYEGNHYYLFTKRVYSDIRLVGAPPSSIGKFGADTDNWMWPRHTGDFSLFRIYTDREGNPAAYDPANVPLKPKRWLTLSTKGVKEDDFAMILGFPGSTHKYATSWEVAERRDIDNAVRITMREIRQEALLEEMLRDPAVKIQYASKYSGSANAYKNAVGTNWAIEKRDFVALKRQQQERLASWASAHGKHHYQRVLERIREMVEDRSPLRYRSWMLDEAILRGVEFATLPTATGDSLAEALKEGREAEVEELLKQLEHDYHRFANKDYHAEVDRRVAKRMIAAYIDSVPRADQPSCFNLIYTHFDGNSDRYVDHIFAQSLFASEANLQSFITTPDIDRLTSDPMFLFARAVKEEREALHRALRQFDQPIAEARHHYLEGILAMDGPHAGFPDANLTLRLSYGQVRGYHPRDGVVYRHLTTLEGVMEKEDPANWEFVVPARLKELYRQKEFGPYGLPGGGMPVAFTATTHTTGGNSGSPVMNGKGELIGINFDRNWEGVGGDIQYLPDYQRSIIVDIRYVLFLIDHFAGATHLVEEMELR